MLPSRAHGFHITRKTFASRMLVHNFAAGRIAETLGHADNSSVMTYLSTNGDKMRLRGPVTRKSPGEWGRAVMNTTLKYKYCSVFAPYIEGLVLQKKSCGFAYDCGAYISRSSTSFVLSAVARNRA